jgi:hypothetical protein
MIDVGRRVPIFGSQIPKAGDCASFPKNGVAGGSASDCLVAVSGDADNLPALLIAVAAPEESPGGVGSSLIAPLLACQTTGRNCRT